MDATRADFVERMSDAVEKLASFEKRSVTGILADLQNYDSDVLRYRVASRRTTRGTLPLSQAIDLLKGAKQSLLAAAHSVLVPRKHHPKLNRTEAIQLLDACQMGQTEQGSFIVSITCPMKAVDAEEAGNPTDRVPFARRATLQLDRALVALSDAIEEDRINSIVDQADPQVSANLCDAMLKMRPGDEDGILEFIPSWAASEPTPDALSRAVTFTYDEFASIEEIYRQLRPVETPRARPWIGIVDELKGNEVESGTREGEVLVTLWDEDELIRAKASLSAEQYRIAYEAHNPSRPLVVVGELTRGPRISRLSRITELRLALPDETQAGT